jgi:hypothetical protein
MVFSDAVTSPRCCTSSCCPTVETFSSPGNKPLSLSVHLHDEYWTGEASESARKINKIPVCEKDEVCTCGH